METRITHQRILWLGGLSILCYLLFIYGIGRLPFLGPDEPRYAEVAREMFETGDWITPRLAGIPWFEKPALLYWMAALGYAVLGVSEIAARIGVALTASLGVLVLAVAGRRIASARFGYLSAAALASMGLWIGFARGVTFDMPLAVTVEVALLAFFLWERQRANNAKDARYWYVGCLCIGLATLAKGLVGLILPVAIIASYFILTRQLWSLIRRPRLIFVGLAIIAGTAATWYGPMLARHGRVFVDEFFVAHHFERYLSNAYRHPQPVYFYIIVLLAGCFPWLIYLIAAAARDFRHPLRLLEEDRRLDLFLWLWILIPVVFFSFSGSKLPGYILPVFPAVAIRIGLELDRNSRYLSWPVVLTALVVICVSAGFASSGPASLGLSPRSALIIAALGIVAGFGFVIVSKRFGETRGAIALTILLGAVIIGSVHIVFPGLAQRESISSLALLARENAKPDERLVFYLDSDQGVNFYATSLPLRDRRAELVTFLHGDQMASFLKERAIESVLVMSYVRRSKELTINPVLNVELLATQGRALDCSPDCDWVLLRVSPRRESSAMVR